MYPIGPATVVALELSDGIPELRPATDAAGMYVIFFWRGIALGHRYFSNSQLPVTGEQLAAFAAHSIAPAAGDRIFDIGFQSFLPALPQQTLHRPQQTLQSIVMLGAPLNALKGGEQATPSYAVETSVSVAICSKDRPQQLLRCIESLSASLAAPHEIIVIDNNSQTGETEEVTLRFPGVRYYKELNRGLSAARNAALHVATGEIVAFVDDDVEVTPHWLAAINNSFGDPRVMVVTGLVLPAELLTDAQIIFENLGYLNKGYRRRLFGRDSFRDFDKQAPPVWCLGAGANMAIRRKAFLSGYTFDTRLGPGVFGGCGEDSAYLYDLIADGWFCLYEPAASVYHYHRRDLNALRRLIRSYMQGHVAALLLQYRKHGDRGNLRRLCVDLPLMYAQILKQAILSRFCVESRALLAGIPGCLSGVRFALIADSSARDKHVH
jgi:glycosyltransferase involved in cell wall biosynthesis